MKHALMAYFILFSALSSSWAGAVVLPVAQNNSAHLQQVFSEQETSLSIQHQEHLVMGCASVSSEENRVQKMDYEYCVNCFDQCQCDNSTCHKVNSPLVGIHIDPINIQDMAKISPLFVFAPLQSAPIFLDFRPPKNA